MEALANPDCGWFYRRSADAFSAIPASPIAYWMPTSFSESFINGISIDEISDFTGSQNITGDNNKYLRYRWEVDSAKIGKGSGWIPYAKGGEYRRWYGNIDHVVDWSERGRAFYKSNATSNLLSKEYWFREGITYNAITSARPHFRYMPEGCVFDKGGPSISGLNEHLAVVLAFLNSTTCESYLDAVNPTLNLQVKDIKTLPLLLDAVNESNLESLVQENISLSRSDWDAFETSWDFAHHPLV